jgi:hypothetical protein
VSAPAHGLGLGHPFVGYVSGHVAIVAVTDLQNVRKVACL